MPSKTNILIYHDELLPASETFILAQAESLRHFNPIYTGLRRIPGLEVPSNRCVLLSSASNPHLGKLRRVRAKLFGPTSRGVAELRKLRPALIHAHFGVDATNAMSLSQELGIPLVVTFHGYDATISDEMFRRRSLAARLYVHRRPLLAKRAARFICVSEYIQRAVLDKGFPSDKTVVHYTGVDLSQFTPDPTVVRSASVLFVGRLVTKKGCEYLIEAMKTVQGRLPDTELVIIGDGPLRSELEKKAAATLTNFQFLGLQGRATIRHWMNRAKVFSMPSVVAESGDAEGLPTVLIESQSMGLPVASFATGGIPEAVHHNVTGLLGPSRDCGVLAQNIIRLLTNQQAWEKFSEAGKRYVGEEFDINKQAVKLERIYCDVLASETRQALAAS